MKRKIEKAVLLDRDETLNFDPGYIRDPSVVRLKPGVVEGLCRLRDAGFQFFVLSNQSGINRGLIKPEELEAVHARLLGLLAEHNLYIEKIYVCPHTDEDKCDCRKPKSGLIDRVFSEYDLDAEHTYLAGDRLRDIIPGEARGIDGVMVYNDPEPDLPIPSNLIRSASDLLEAAECILMRDAEKRSAGFALKNKL
jgi:histidinol-phosphate phosphatase family protein